jgi:hypothetical protein
LLLFQLKQRKKNHLLLPKDLHFHLSHPFFFLRKKIICRCCSSAPPPHPDYPLFGSGRYSLNLLKSERGEREW